MVPLHSYKFISTLQHVLAGYQGSPQRNPLLLHVESRAGHGGGAACRVLNACTVAGTIRALCFEPLASYTMQGSAAPEGFSMHDNGIATGTY